jgi:hypothetical protein
MRFCLFGAIFLAANVIALTGANASIAISSASTQNMTCSSGVCSPTQSSAVLNVTDLENMLATGSVTVTTTGSGVQADDIVVDDAFHWAGTNGLSLDAWQWITIDKPVTVEGLGAVSLTTDDGGTGGELSFGRKGHITFQNLSSPLTIDGTAFLLVNSVASLASAVDANPDGAYALASAYDASGDGTYTSSPVQATFAGIFDGLGNTISNLSMENGLSQNRLGLFGISTGVIENVGLLHVSVAGAKKGQDAVGIIVGVSNGDLTGDFATGSIRVQGSNGSVGGLAGVAININRSHADVTIHGGKAAYEQAGGLAGFFDDGALGESYATGAIMVGNSGIAGGLVGMNFDSDIQNSYATGAVAGGSSARIGGLIGEEKKFSGLFQTVQTSYSTGAVSAGMSSFVGGFIGTSNSESRYTDAYWDTMSSGTYQPTGKGKARGVEGLTTEQFQSDLPEGFDPAIWGEKPGINGGLPYLLNNPPPKK